jgi:hypothetical protein
MRRAPKAGGYSTKSRCEGAVQQRRGEDGASWTRLQEIWDEARERREKKRREEERRQREEEAQRARALESHRRAVEENYRRFKQAIREGRARSAKRHPNQPPATVAADELYAEPGGDDGGDLEPDGPFDKGCYGEAMRIMPGYLAERHQAPPPRRPHVLVPLDDAPEAPPEVAEPAKGLAARLALLPLSAPAAATVVSSSPVVPVPKAVPPAATAPAHAKQRTPEQLR